MVLLDTCALIWYTLDFEQLSLSAARKCEQIPREGACVSSISLWEIGLKIKNKKLDIGITVEEYVKRLKSIGTIKIIAVDENIWLKNLSLDWAHRDPADRTIVATAMLRNLPIMTSDSTIHQFYPQVIW